MTTTNECAPRLDAPGMRRAPDVSRQEQAEAALRAASAPPTTRLAFRVPVPVYDVLYRVAADRRMTVSAVMRAAIRLFLRNLGHSV